MRVKIFVSLKTGVLDPQGKAIERSLHTLGYNEVQDVRMGKYLEIEMDARFAPGRRDSGTRDVR